MNFDLSRTICAISSPPGVSLRAVIRISGANAFGAISSISSATIDSLTHSSFLDAQLHFPSFSINCKLLCFHAPRSFTGENVVEIHVGGSQAIADLIINQLLKNNVSMAGPGEFTRLAFENGKLDLNQAQGVLDLIHSSDTDSRRAALFALGGNLTQELNRARTKLLEILFRLEANLDFSEDEIEIIPADELRTSVFETRKYLETVIENSSTTRSASSPIVAIVGAANAGKSTLFNRLVAGKALVSEIPGTTRDALRAEVKWHGASLEIWDTAGSSIIDSHIEKAAEEMTANLISSADIVLFVLSPDTPLDLLDSFELQPQVKYIFAINKCDAFNSESSEVQHVIRLLRKKLGKQFPKQLIHFSGKSGVSVDSIREKILNAISDFSGGGRVFLSQWQREGIFRAYEETIEALHTIDEGIPQEITALNLRSAVTGLDIFQSVHVADDVLDKIFSNFCIGK